MKTVIAGVSVFAIVVFLVWYSGINIFERNERNVAVIVAAICSALLTMAVASEHL